MPTANIPLAYQALEWVSPLIVPPAAVEAVHEAEAHQAKVITLRNEHREAERAVTAADRNRADVVRAAVEAGKPSPSRDASLEDTVTDLAERLEATIDLRAVATRKAHLATLAAAPEMLASLPDRIEKALDEVDAKGLTAERAAEVSLLLSALAYYVRLDYSHNTLRWTPKMVEVQACYAIDVLGMFRSATQAAVGRILRPA